MSKNKTTSYQQRHEKLVQINDLNAAHFQWHFTIHFGHVHISFSCCSLWIKGQRKPEHLIPHYRDGLQKSYSAQSGSIRFLAAGSILLCLFSPRRLPEQLIRIRNKTAPPLRPIVWKAHDYQEPLMLLFIWLLSTTLSLSMKHTWLTVVAQQFHFPYIPFYELSWGQRLLLWSPEAWQKLQSVSAW